MRSEEEIKTALTWINRANANAEADAVQMKGAWNRLSPEEHLAEFEADREAKQKKHEETREALYLHWALQQVEMFIEWLLEKETDAANKFAVDLNYSMWRERLGSPEFLEHLRRNEELPDQEQVDEEDE
jgi:hypothetical protein